jgi:hypothetical protein
MEVRFPADLDDDVNPVMVRRILASLASDEFVYLEEGHPA